MTHIGLSRAGSGRLLPLPLWSSQPHLSPLPSRERREALPQKEKETRLLSPLGKGETLPSTERREEKRTLPSGERKADSFSSRKTAAKGYLLSGLVVLLSPWERVRAVGCRVRALTGHFFVLETMKTCVTNPPGEYTSLRFPRRSAILVGVKGDSWLNL